MLKPKSFLYCILFYTMVFIFLTTFGCVKKPTSVCTLEQLEVRGFRLGVPLSEIKKKYPEKYFSDLLGGGGKVISLDTFFADKTKYPELNGLDRILLSAERGNIVELIFYYEQTSDTSDEFKAQFFKKMQESLNLNGEWQQPDPEKDEKIMNCGKYRIKAVLSPKVNTMLSPGTEGWFKYEPYLAIEDVEMKNNLRQGENLKQQEEYKQKREEFNP
jgi:hypothetical protein